MLTQFKWLMWRNLIDLIRDPLVCTVYFIQTMVLNKIKTEQISLFFQISIQVISCRVWFYFFSFRT